MSSVPCIVHRGAEHVVDEADHVDRERKVTVGSKTRGRQDRTRGGGQQG